MSYIVMLHFMVYLRTCYMLQCVYMQFIFHDMHLLQEGHDGSCHPRKCGGCGSLARWRPGRRQFVAGHAWQAPRLQPTARARLRCTLLPLVAMWMWCLDCTEHGILLVASPQVGHYQKCNHWD